MIFKTTPTRLREIADILEQAALNEKDAVLASLHTPKPWDVYFKEPLVTENEPCDFPDSVIIRYVAGHDQNFLRGRCLREKIRVSCYGEDGLLTLAEVVQSSDPQNPIKDV